MPASFIAVGGDSQYTTIQQGITAAQAAGVTKIVVAGGTYAETDGLSAANSGLTIEAASGASVTLNGSFTISDACEVTISGLTFQGDGTTVAVSAVNSTKLVITGNTFSGTGQAILLDGTTDSTIANNLITNTTLSAIEEKNGADGNTVINNVIDGDIGDPNYPTNGAIWLHGATDGLIANNQISNTNNAGISLSDFLTNGATQNNNTVVEDNVLSNVVANTSDNGAIYVLGRSQEPETGIVIRSNFIGATGFVTDPHAVGIYLDDNASGVTVTQNIVQASEGLTDPFEIHGGSNNTISGNIFDLGTGGPVHPDFGLFQIDEDDQTPSTGVQLTNDVVSGNIFVTESATPHNPGFADIPDSQSVGSGITINGNDFWSYSGAPLNVAGTGPVGDAAATYAPPAAGPAMSSSDYGSWSGAGIGFTPIDIAAIGPTGAIGSASAGDTTGATILTSAQGAVTVSIWLDQTVDLGGIIAANDVGTDPLILEGPGTASFSGSGTFTNLEVADGGTLLLRGGTIVTDPVTVDANGNTSGFGTITGNETVGGTITAEGGTLDITGNVDGTGVLTIDPGATLELDGSVGADITIEFASGGTGVLELADPAGVQATIVGEVAGDQVIYLPCYASGTHILTDCGERAVERLRIGDRAMALLGQGFASVKWLGHRTLDLRAHPFPDRVQPIRISAGAFGGSKPHRNLWVSPKHAILVDDVLIPAERLINGATIIQEDWDAVTYWHVELERHDVLIAEGLAAESYLDTGNRAAFANAGACQELHPDFLPKHWTETCRPLVLDGLALETVKARLLDRAISEFGYSITDDQGLHVLADGKEIPVCTQEGSVFRFQVPAGCADIKLVSRTWVPAHLLSTSMDTRALGVCVAKLVVDGNDLALDHPTLSVGWHEAEFDARQRWTKGAGCLPAGAENIILELHDDRWYWTHDPGSLDIRVEGKLRSVNVR